MTVATGNIYLVINKISYKYIRYVSDYILSTIQTLSSSNTTRLIIDHVDDFDYPSGSVIFIIGDPFPIFVKKSDCFYIFINFSLLYNVTGRWLVSRIAVRWFKNKHKIFMAKRHCFDMILDYYHPQSPILDKELNNSSRSIKVLPFLTNTKRSPNVSLNPIDKCKWDICFIGGMSPRRAKLIGKLRKLGYRLSPLETTDFQSVIGQSKLILNIHMHACDTLEAPRIFEVLNMGRCLVTEYCYGLSDLVPDYCYCSDKYSRLTGHIHELLDNPDRIIETGNAAGAYMQNEYEKKCQLSWKRIIEEIPS